MSDVPEMMKEIKILKQEEKVNFLNIKGQLQEILLYLMTECHQETSFPKS